MFAVAKRFFLFFILNIFIMITLSALWFFASQYFGLSAGTHQYLLLYCAVFGFGGAFISLLMSKFFAKMAMRVQILDPNTRDQHSRDLLDRVYALSKAAGLTKMPEVGIYESPEVNAFATGPSRNNSLVAVSSGLLQRMTRDEVDGVIGHEIAHVANGDMVTMTLLQGVMNTTVMFLSRILANIVAGQVKSEGGRSGVYFASMIVFEIVFSILGLIVVSFYSRAREYRADAGGARFAGREKMTAALRKLQSFHELVDTDQPALATLKINGRRPNALMALFSTHPPIQERIRRLETGRI